MVTHKNMGTVFSADIIEFVTLASKYCAFMEHPDVENEAELYRFVLKLLGAIYQKVLSLPVLPADDDELETYVTEEQYNHVRSQIAVLLGTNDDYLDTFVEDMKYSDKPILRTISEDLADVYQVLGDFVCLYQTEVEDVMFRALSRVVGSFTEYWGGRLLSAMRAVHELLCMSHDEEGQY